MVVRKATFGMRRVIGDEHLVPIYGHHIGKGAANVDAYQTCPAHP
jgi:hypothetical protein